MIVPAIYRLFKWRCPAAVAWFVVAAVVDAVNGVSPTGSFSHVSEEVCKISPAFTNRNSATSIIGIGGMCNALAATKHVTPNAMFGSVMLPMFCESRFHEFNLNTSATLASSHSQRVAADDNFISAIANAIPRKCPMFCSACERDNMPSVELHSSEIFAAEPVNLRIVCSHDTLLHESECCG